MAIAMLGLVATTGCSLLPGVPGGGESENTNHTMIIEITSEDAKRADITYTRGGQQEEEARAKLPWREELTGRRFPKISVTAQSTGSGTDLTCTVTVDGKAEKEVTAKGEFALVVCDLPAMTPSPTEG